MGKLEWSHIAYALISFTEQTSQSRWPLTLMKDQREAHGCHSNRNVQMLSEEHVARRSPDGLAKSPFSSSDQNPPRMFHWDGWFVKRETGSRGQWDTRNVIDFFITYTSMFLPDTLFTMSTL